MSIQEFVHQAWCSSPQKSTLKASEQASLYGSIHKVALMQITQSHISVGPTLKLCCQIALCFGVEAHRNSREHKSLWLWLWLPHCQVCLVASPSDEMFHLSRGSKGEKNTLCRAFYSTIVKTHFQPKYVILWQGWS